MDVYAQERLASGAQLAGDWAEAARIWQEIIAAYPRWEVGWAHYHLAGCYVDLGQLDEAEAVYRQAIEIAPHNPIFRETLESLVQAREAGLI